jgi:hypothetical protein
MAQLPPDGEWLVQLIGEQVVVFRQYTEEEVVRYNVYDDDAMSVAQEVIHNTDLLTDEQKSFAHFWCGYFYARSGM